MVKQDPQNATIEEHLQSLRNRSTNNLNTKGMVDSVKGSGRIESEFNAMYMLNRTDTRNTADNELMQSNAISKNKIEIKNSKKNLPNLPSLPRGG